MSTEVRPATPASPPAAESLPRKILRETARFAAMQTVASVLAWGANIVLAKVLDRRDFGVYGICTFYIGIGALLGDGGLGAALLRRRGEVSREEYRVTLTFLLAVAFVLAAVFFGAAPWIGRRNQMSPAEVNVLRVMAPLYIVGALRVVPYIRLERDLAFSTIARIELRASTARHVLAIALALLGGGVWALVAANLAGSSLQLALAYRASPGWVGVGFSWKTFRPLLAYGGQVQALMVASYLKDNISRALLGNRLGPDAVGTFDFGMAYIQGPVAAVNSLARVQLPVYARLDREDPTLFSALRGAMRTAMLFGIPLLLALALAAPWVVPTLYDAKWAFAYPVIWGLLANMVGGLCASPLFTLLQGQGRAGLAIGVFAGWTLATWALAIAAVLVFPGDLGMIALAHSVVTVAVVIGLIGWAGRHLGRGLYTSLVTPALAGILGVAAGVELDRRAQGALGHPVTAAFACVAVYFAVLMVAERRLVVAEFKTVIAGVRGKAKAGGAKGDGGEVERAA